MSETRTVGSSGNQVLLDAVRHNNWATRRLVEFCRGLTLTEGQLTTPGIGTFGGIVATLEHIILADASYLRRLAGDPPDWVRRDEGADLDQLAVWADEIEQLWERLLSEPIDTERVIVVVDDGIREVHAGIFLAQALNHANHHREQVCAILTGFGIEPPDIQAWEYAWTTGRIWERTVND